ncbi:MAG: SUF system Fe-S cluster assembly protein [Phycisphaerales bacterium]|nr:SUF system Fe-S cluster assembly protein [Phycisphaerales bacterium]
MSIERDQVIAAIKTVQDPEIPVDLYELGLIYELDIKDTGDVHVVMTLTTPNCPVAETLPGMVENAVRTVEGVGEVTIDLVFEPTWDPSRMSEAAKLELDFTGKFDPAAMGRKRTTGLTVGRRSPKRDDQS